MPDALRRFFVSVRSLSRYPGLAAGVIVTLTVCIASTASVLALHRSFLERLPVPEAERVVTVYTGTEGYAYGASSLPDFRDYEALGSVFSALTAEGSFGGVLVHGEVEDWVWGATVTADFFEALKVTPALGRGFTAEEGERGGPRAVVLSHAFWRSRFGGDPDVIGRTLRLQDATFSVVGVAPARFRGTNSFFHPAVWVPLWNIDALTPPQAAYLENRDYRAFTVTGRLAPGVSVAQAQEALAAAAGHLDSEYPSGLGARIPLVAAAAWTPPSAREAYGTTVRILLIAVALLIAIGLVNIVTLVLARTIARRDELATRIALGGSRGGAILDTAAGLLPLALVGIALGLVLARFAQVAMAGYFAPAVPGDLGDPPILRTDPTVLAVTAAIALVIVLAASVLPVLFVARRRLVPVLGRNRVLGGRAAGITALVVAQIVISTALLSVGGLLARSMAAILDTDPGFRVESYLLTRITLLRGGYTPPQGLLAWERIRAEVARVPGVSAATLTSVPPLSGFSQNDTVRLAERPDEAFDVDGVLVDVPYARALGLTVVEGRWFETGDTGASRPVAVVTRDFARRLWPDGAAVGRAIQTAGRPGAAVEIVGVVEETRFMSLAFPPTELIYHPLAQRYQGALTLMTRTELPPETVTAPVRQAIQTADPSASAVYSIRMVDFLEGSIWEPRMRAEVLQVFALVALATAMVGLFALMRFRVARARPEIGLRMALGASRRRIMGQFIGRGVRLAAIGAAAGVLAALAGSRWVQSLLHGIQASDPLTLAGVAALMIAAAALACWLPARNASRVDPAQTLRDG